MTNWLSAIARKAWSLIRQALPNLCHPRNGPSTQPHPSVRDASPPRPIVSRRPPRTPSAYPPTPLVVRNIAISGPPDDDALCAYLRGRENHPEDIRKACGLLQMPQVMLEIGCGGAEAARLIALKNPDMGVIATDLYDFKRSPSEGSYYGKIARLWRARQLPAQQDTPANLVILRAEADVLCHLPLEAIDTILLINPEPCVGKGFLDLLRKDALYLRIKQGPTRLVILPYSRELGVMACGGCSFEHDPDWSKGLGYLMASGLPFRRGLPVQWGVDLSSISAYSGNSTQCDLYVCGDPD